MKTNRIKASAYPVHQLYFIQRDVDIKLDVEAEDVIEFKTEEKELDGIEIEQEIAEEIAEEIKEEIKDAMVAEMTFEVLEKQDEKQVHEEVIHTNLRKDAQADEAKPLGGKKNQSKKMIEDKVLQAITHRLRG